MYSVINDHFIFLLLWFFVFFYFVCWFVYIMIKRKMVTVLSTTIIMNIFIPLVLMYPFALSPKNIPATGYTWYLRYLNYIDKAFIISLIGILGFIIGCLVARSKQADNFPVLNSVSQSFKFLSKTSSLLVLSLFLIGLFFLMYKLGYFAQGNTARAYAMANPAVRPIANLFLALLPLFVSLSLFVFHTKRSILAIFFILIGILLGLTSGTRTATLGGILLFIYAKFNFQSKKRSNLLKIVFLGFVLLFLAIYIGDLREHQYNPFVTIDKLYNKLFYGNNFSDLRDFAWVLSGWDESYLYGRTQLAGLLSFIPSSIFSFREEWRLGVFTTRVLGFDHSIHPGLRPGIFGEPYFNFGYIGVMFFGFLYGYIIYRIHLFAQKSLVLEDKYQSMNNILSSYVTAHLSINFMITAGFFSVYVVGGIILIGVVLTRFRLYRYSSPYF